MVKGWFVETIDEQRAIEEMEATSDRAAAIVIAALVEDRLTSALQASMANIPSVKNDFFRSSGPLGSFASKIDLAVLIGLLSEDAQNDLHTMRRIRNVFAHTLKPTEFHTDDKIRELSKKFILIGKMMCDMESENEPRGFNFSIKIADYDFLMSQPRGRYMLAGRLFVAGIDGRARARSFTPDPWL